MKVLMKISRKNIKETVTASGGDDGQLLVRVGHVIFSQQFPGFIDQSMQCQHPPGAEHCVQALLGDLPMAACLIAF